MDRPPHDYAAAMAFAQQQQQAGNLPGQQFPFPPQHQQFPPSVHGPPFLPPHPSVQQYPFPRQQQPQSMHPHPSHPHLLHHQQQPGPAFPPHAPPHMGPPFPGGPYDSAPPPVPPPHDPELQKRIDKLVEYVAKNGPEFEAMVCEKEHGNPAYSFLFGGDGHGYYRYKLCLFTRPPGPFGSPFPTSMPVMHPPSMNPSGASGPMMGAPQMHQPPFPHFYDQQQPHSQAYMGHGRPEYDRSPNIIRGLSGPLPYDVAMELNNVVVNLSGTKESIKSAKAWFMQRSAFAPALAETLRERVFALDDSEKQLHIIYLANDILFDSFQRRVNPRELDNEALAFKPVLGSMLARIYHHPQNKDENQSRLQKIVQFWASKEVYDQETIHALEGEMLAGPSASSFLGAPKEMSGSSVDPSGVPHQAGISNLPQWQHDKQNSLHHQEQPDRHGPMLAMIPGQQFIPHPVPPIGFAGSIPPNSAVPPVNQQHAPNVLQQPLPNVGGKLPTYPLFPPGLIPGMVKKQQIGSGVPYSPMSPLDIPTVIPPSDTPESELLERVSKFFKEIGEVNPSEGPMNGSEGRYEDDYERASPVRKGGACIPPPPNLQADTDTEPASFGGSGRLGLGATSTPDEGSQGSQYDDVYGSYRKQRSSNYHTSMSARAAIK
ncbi:hypothetical protein RND81_06G210200 [Saponaria officinalis]|uniref:Calcium homeostasis endoplasmic reticulum protein n=1 Tax=Saponaria officinalis TaxID=3572 RepID=A0AAW1KDF2_SAPOF